MINGRSFLNNEGQIGFPTVRHIAPQLIDKDYITGRTKIYSYLG
jgi:hypothetical protein